MERRDWRDREVISGKMLIATIDGAFPVQFSSTVPALQNKRRTIGPMKPPRINSTSCLSNLEIGCKCFLKKDLQMPSLIKTIVT